MRSPLAIVLISASLAAGPPPKDLDRIQGAWDVAGIEINGKAQPKGPGPAMQVTFEGDKLLVSSGRRPPEHRGTVRLDQGRDPKTDDLTTPEGAAVPGIYVLDGDRLKVCLGTPGEERPKTLTTSPDDGRTLLIYKRAKPARGR